MPIIIPKNLIQPPKNMLENLIHPLEKANFAELQANKLFTGILTVMGSTHTGLTSLAEVPDRSLIVTSKTFPRLYKAYEIAHDKLELENDCDLFCNFEYGRDAKTFGTDDDCIIVVDSSCLEDFSDKQILALLGRELAHIKFKHVKYLTAFNFIDYLVGFLPSFLVSVGAVSALKGLLLDYLLATQFTADRAAAFVAGDVLPVIQNNLMTSGLETSDECIDFELYTQITLPEDLNHFDRAAKLLMTNTLRDFPMPFVIPRIRELAAWSKSEECREFLPEISHARQIISRENRPTNQMLFRGQRINLLIEQLKFAADFKQIPSLEIDIAAFLSQADGKVAGDEDFVFYGNNSHKSGAVILNADNSIEIDLEKVPRNVEKIFLTATIYDANKRKQNFGMIECIVLNILGADREIASFSLEDFTIETAIVLGEVYRYKGKWKFKATGAGFSGGLAVLCENFGVNVTTS